MPPKRRTASRGRGRSRGGSRAPRRSPSPVQPTVNSQDALPSTILPADDANLPSFRASLHDAQRAKPSTADTRNRQTRTSNNNNNNNINKEGAYGDADLAQAAEAMHTRLSSGPARRTVSIHDVDPWLRFNVYVRRGYRPSRLSVREAFLSIFLYFHNETVNIFSHLLPCLLMLYWTLNPPVTPFFWTLEQQLGRQEALAGRTGKGQVDSTSGTAASAQSTAASSLASRWSRADVWGDKASATASTGAAPGYRPPSAGGPLSWFLRNPIDETVGRATTPLLFPPSSSGAGVGSDGTGAALSNRYLQSDPRPILALLCAAFTMTFFLSAVYHAFMPCPHTERGYRQLLQCDVAGVLFTIAGSVYVYFERGNPCASPSLQRSLGILMWVSSIATVYALLIAPVQAELWETLLGLVRAVQYTIAELVCAFVEVLRGGRPLEAPHPQSANVLWHWLWKGHCRFRRWRRDGRFHVLMHDLDNEDAADEGNHSHHHHQNSNTRERHERSPPPSRPPVSAFQRALMVLCHCILHFVCFVLIVAPKRRAYGFTEAVYYHGMSYAWLICGGAINALRLPERWVTQLRARAHAQQAAQAEKDAQELCMRRLAAERDGRNGRGGEDSELQSTVLVRLAQGIRRRLKRFSLCHFITHYVISNRDLDYCGNSHNIWHMCTVMSALCMVAGAYYDCVEYELIRCAG